MRTRILGTGAWALLVAASLTLVAVGASAFTPANQDAIYEIRLPDYDFIGHDSFDRDMGMQGVKQSLAARYGGRWSVYAWDGLSGTPRHVFGSSVQLASAVGSAEELDALSRQVIAANADVLRADLDNLRLESTPHALGKWVAHYQQTYHGIDVLGAQVRVAISDDGKLLLMGSDYFSDIAVDPSPAVSAAMAEALAKESLPFDPSTDSVSAAPKLFVLPLALSESMVEHHLVWRLTVRTAEPFGAWETLVDAHTGDILARDNQIEFAYGGDTTTEAQIYGYCDGITTTTMPYLNINVSGVGTTASDALGDWTINGTGGNRSVTAAMSGTYVTVINQNGPEAAFSGTASENVPFNVYFDDSNARHDERDTFDAVNDIKAFFDLFDPSFSYSNAHINAYVNRTDGYCPGNAWWDGTINFCAGTTSYGNTGELQQVVHHEFGHGVQAAILGSQGSQGLGEGHGDILGNLITQDPIIGRGFYLNNCTSGIRNSVNNLQYPGDVVGQEIHYAGQVIAGFNWDLMVLLQGIYGGGSWDSPGTVEAAKLWHFGRMLLHPSTQPDQVFSAFFADDDNNDLDDGTPHHEQICEAAMNHGFDCPEVLVGVFVYHESIPYSGNQSSGYAVVGQAVSLGGGAIVTGSVQMHYRVDGGSFSTLVMGGTGNPDEFAATIPAQSFGSVVEYYIEADNDLGGHGTSPTNAPTALHYFQVNDNFPDEMEFDTAWHTGNNTEETAATGRWERADPQATGAQPEDDHTATGTDCWVTGPLAGSSIGAYDVDSGQTVLYSPRFDLVGASDVSISYWRWYSNDQGSNPGLDYWTAQISNDDGATWTNVEYTQASSNAWVQVMFDLQTYFATPGIVQMRFIASDDANGSIVEALVDDFLLMGTFDLTGVGDGVTTQFVTQLDQNSPNPFNPKTEIRFSLQQAGQASLKIYDAQGRLVRSLVDGVLQAGEQRVTWDGSTASGQRAASGVYFYRLETPESSVSKRMVLLK